MDILALLIYFIIGFAVAAYVDTQLELGPVLFGMIAYGWLMVLVLYALAVAVGVVPGRFAPGRIC